MFVKIILLIVMWMLIRRFLRGMGKKKQGSKARFNAAGQAPSSGPGKNSPGKTEEDPFKKITQQDIDDADFEEIP